MRFAGSILGPVLVWQLGASCSSPTPAPAPAVGLVSQPPGSRNATVIPSVHLPQNFGPATLDCWAAGTNASLTTAGNTVLLQTETELEFVTDTQVPLPLEAVVLPPMSNTTRMLLGVAFGGSACITYSLSANSSDAQIQLADFNALYDPNFQKYPPVLDYTICSSSNCSKPQTAALNMTGRYYFAYLNNGASWVNMSVTYVLHDPTDPACRGASQLPPVPRSPPYPANLTSLVHPALLFTKFYDSSGIPGSLTYLGSFRNASCFAATLASTVNPIYNDFRQTTNATLILLSTFGVEVALNGSASSPVLPAGQCAAGTSMSKPSCSFVAGDLDPQDLYFLILAYPGEAFTSMSNATRSAIRLDTAFSAYDTGLADQIPGCSLPNATPKAPAPAPAMAIGRP